MSTADHSALSPDQRRAVELVSYLAVNLVDHPDDVRVDLVAEADRDVVQLHVHPDDLGQIIGKGGQTARSLRSLLTAVGARMDARIGLEICE